MIDIQDTQIDTTSSSTRRGSGFFSRVSLSRSQPRALNQTIVGAAEEQGGVTAARLVTDIVFWAGALFANRSTAPFRVNAQGDLVATSATITGSFTATSGTIGGFEIGSDYIRDVANSFGLASTVSGSDDVRFWAGDTFANRASAPVRITEAGALVATNATITGSITATSGSIGGFTIGATTLSITSGGNTVTISSGSNAFIAGPTGSPTVIITQAGVATLSDVVITGSSSTFDGSLVTDVRARAEAFFNNFGFMGGANDGLVEVPGTGGTITREHTSTILDTGGGGGAGTDCMLGTDTNFQFITWDDDLEISIIMKTEVITVQDVWIGSGLITSGTLPTDATKTERHLSFMIQDGTLYASNADGTTQTRTDISSGITLTDLNRYRIVYEAGVSAKFYVNDVLKATHTTNLPSGSGEQSFLVGINSSGTDNRSIYIGNNYLVLSNAPQ